MPYQRYSRILSFILVALVALLFLWPTAPAFLVTIGYALATLVFAAFLLDAYFLFKDFQKRHLFFIRNTSLLISVFTSLLFPFLLAFNPPTQPELWLIFYPVFLSYSISNLFRVRMDQVSMSIKTGVGKPQEITLFQIEQTLLTEEHVDIMLNNGEQFRLEGSHFFSSDWVRLRERLSEWQKS